MTKTDMQAVPDTSAMATPGRRYRGASNEQRQMERRQKLISAGLHCFAQDGYHQVTVRGVCATAGLTERYFYESFSGMEALFQAVYLDVAGQVRTRIFAAVENVSPQQLDAFARSAMGAFFDCLQQQPMWVPILFQEALSISPQMTELALATLRGFVDLLMMIGRSSFTREDAPWMDAGLISSGLVGGIMHIAVRWAETGFQVPTQTVVNNAMLIFEGLLRFANEDASAV